jgi:hypothetical protein
MKLAHVRSTLRASGRWSPEEIRIIESLFEQQAEQQQQIVHLAKEFLRITSIMGVHTHILDEQKKGLEELTRGRPDDEH